MSKSPFVKSFDGFGNQQTDKTLPSIYSSRKGPIKSPVAESIRMSKQNRSRAFASMSKYRDETPDMDSASDRSDNSKISNMRKSYISRRNNPKNQSIVGGKFFVHKREKSANPVEKNPNIVRASTILNSSMMFGKNRRNSKANRNKESINFGKGIDVQASNNGGLRGMKRGSKTFVEAEVFKNKLTTAKKSKRGMIPVNP